MHIYYESDYCERQMLSRDISPTNSLPRFPTMTSQNFNTSEVLDQNSQVSKKKDFFHLKKLLMKHKVRILNNNFIRKLRQNNVYRKPPEDGFLQSSEQLNLYNSLFKKLQNTEGLVLGNIALTVWSFVNVVQLTIMVFIFSINIVFEQTQDNVLFLQFRIFSVILYVLDMVLNFTTQRFESGKRLINLKEIGQFYIGSGFFIDFISIVMFPIYLIVDSQVTMFISLISLIKLWNSIKKFQKFEYLYIKSSEKQIYYGLIKVIITNFCIGHILSILLNLMATYNHNEKNWHKLINILDESWFIKYVWGYYWGTNIMLTVGFGDLVATTYVEAIFLIFIETFSCITLAYNISTVGSLMSELKSKDEKKKKQLKIFHRMSEENEISNELTTRVSNFIEESFQIRQTFQFDQEDEVIDSLPKGIQSQYRIQANKILFDNIGFLNNMSSKTLVNLAENIERKISHPDQIIKKKGSLSSFTIISNGSIGLCCRKQGSKLNGQAIQKLIVEKGGKPKLISLNFIKGKLYEYDVKSLGYSIVYFLQREKFMQCLKDFELDYQFFCTMRDRDEYLLGENELYPCSVCKTEFHNRFNCHKLHFMPITQHVVRKCCVKQPQCDRDFIERAQKEDLKFRDVLKMSGLYKKDYERFLKHHFGKNYIDKLQTSKMFFQKSNKLQSLSQKGTSRRLEFVSKHKIQDEIINTPGKNRKMTEIPPQQNYQKIQKLVLRDQNQQKDFWELEIDQICNFKYYFTSFNPERLGNNEKLKSTCEPTYIM